MVSTNTLEAMQNPENNGDVFLLESQSNGVKYKDSRSLIINCNSYNFDPSEGAQERKHMHSTLRLGSS